MSLDIFEVRCGDTSSCTKLGLSQLGATVGSWSAWWAWSRGHLDWGVEAGLEEIGESGLLILDGGVVGTSLSVVGALEAVEGAVGSLADVLELSEEGGVHGGVLDVALEAGLVWHPVDLADGSWDPGGGVLVLLEHGFVSDVH